jgi:hypothetical protein
MTFCLLEESCLVALPGLSTLTSIYYNNVEITIYLRAFLAPAALRKEVRFVVWSGETAPHHKTNLFAKRRRLPCMAPERS